jgi:hypothetical protein
VAAAPGQDEPARPAPGQPPEPVVVDVRGLGTDTTGSPFGAVAALARLALAARRTGRRVRLRGAAPGLRGLLERSGLAGEFEWEPEEGEQVGGVEE